MSRLIEHKGRALLLEPYEAAEHDPPLAEWLKLTVARCHDGCPHCGGPHFGTRNPIGYLHVKVCHNAECGKEYRHAPSVWDIRNLCDALTGVPKRLGRA